MPSKKSPEPPKTLKDLTPVQVAKAAAEATVKLMLDGKKLPETGAAQAVWRACRMENDPSAVPTYFRAIIDGPEYKTLLDIKLRRVTLSSVDGVKFLKSLAKDIARLAGDSLLEDLILKPQLIHPKDKQKMMLEAAEVFERLQAKELPEGIPQTAGSLEEAATQQVTDLEKRMENLPKELQERLIKSWKLESLRALDEREKELRQIGRPTEQAG